MRGLAHRENLDDLVSVRVDDRDLAGRVVRDIKQPVLKTVIQCGFGAAVMVPTSFLVAVLITSMSSWPGPLMAFMVPFIVMLLWFGT